MTSFIESKRGRRLVGRVHADELGAALVQACTQHAVVAGEVRAHGTLSSATIEGAGGAPKKFDGETQLIQLSGRVEPGDDGPTLRMHVVLSRGGEVAAGRLVSAAAVQVDVVIEIFDDLPRALASSRAPAAPTWADVAAASTTASTVRTAPPVPPQRPVRPASSGDTDEIILVLGDLIDHPRFGRCEVAQLENDGEFVKVRAPSGRLLRLAVDVLRLLPAGEEGGHRVYRARVA